MQCLRNMETLYKNITPSHQSRAASARPKFSRLDQYSPLVHRARLRVIIPVVLKIGATNRIQLVGIEFLPERLYAVL
jgi:hypothetical protein